MASPSQTQTPIKAILVTRHELLPAQEEAIRKAGIEIVESLAMIPDPTTNKAEFEKFVQNAKARSVNAILTVALPPHLLVALQKHFRILVFKMVAIATVESEEEAKRIVSEKPTHRVALPGRLGEKQTFRIMEFKGIYETKIVIEEKPLVEV